MDNQYWYIGCDYGLLDDYGVYRDLAMAATDDVSGEASDMPVRTADVVINPPMDMDYSQSLPWLDMSRAAGQAAHMLTLDRLMSVDMADIGRRFRNAIESLDEYYGMTPLAVSHLRRERKGSHSAIISLFGSRIVDYDLPRRSYILEDGRFVSEEVVDGIAHNLPSTDSVENSSNVPFTRSTVPPTSNEAVGTTTVNGTTYRRTYIEDALKSIYGCEVSYRHYGTEPHHKMMNGKVVPDSKIKGILAHYETAMSLGVTSESRDKWMADNAPKVLAQKSEWLRVDYTPAAILAGWEAFAKFVNAAEIAMWSETLRYSEYGLEVSDKVISWYGLEVIEAPEHVVPDDGFMVVAKPRAAEAIRRVKVRRGGL